MLKVVGLILFLIFSLIFLTALVVFFYWTTCHPQKRRDLVPTHCETDIDFVVTWVNSSDKAWIDKKCRYGSPGQFDSLRFGDGAVTNIEIETCVKSILKYAPWCRKIWVAVDDQVPNFYKYLPQCDKRKVEIVNHRDFFVDRDVLPVFNSHAIEANMYNIPGLANRFIYLNDDFCFSSPICPSHFYDGDMPVYRSTCIINAKRCPSIIPKIIFRLNPSSEVYIKATSNLSDYGNRLFIWRYSHHAVPLLRSYFGGGPVCNSRFRGIEDTPPVHLAVLNAIKNGWANVYSGKYECLYLEKFRENVDYGAYHEICINALNSVEEATAFQRRVLGLA